MRMYIPVHVILIVTLAIFSGDVYLHVRNWFLIFHMFDTSCPFEICPYNMHCVAIILVWINISQLNASTMIIQYGIGDGV